jgi:hypothetical protein
MIPSLMEGIVNYHVFVRGMAGAQVFVQAQIMSRLSRYQYPWLSYASAYYIQYSSAYSCTCTYL